MAYPGQCFLPLRIAEGTREAHFFMLDQLQKDSEAALWGDEQPQGSVIGQRLLQRLWPLQ